MRKMAFTQEEIEKRIERALENACAYHALHNWKPSFRCYCEAETYLEILEDFGVWYDEDEEDTINEHVQAMLNIMRETKFIITANA